MEAHTEPPQFRLPDCGMFPGRRITQCEWRVRTFVQRDAYAGYDWQGSFAHPMTDTISQYHIFAINSAMRARSSRKAWATFVGQPLPELADIPPHLDLIDASPQEVAGGLQALKAVTKRITSVPGITEMAASKVLYLLRPRFVAIADAYVRDALGVWRGQPEDTMVRVAQAVRECGTSNREALEFLSAFVSRLPQVVPQFGRLRMQRVPVRLTRLRILDILIWTEVAIFGPTPHPYWSQWFGELGLENTPF
jgi:hypothetical protein